MKSSSCSSVAPRRTELNSQVVHLNAPPPPPGSCRPAASLVQEYDTYVNASRFSQGPNGNIYYFNFVTGESIWDHPCDELYRKMVMEERKKPLINRKGKSNNKELQKND